MQSPLTFAKSSSAPWHFVRCRREFLWLTPIVALAHHPAALGLRHDTSTSLRSRYHAAILATRFGPGTRDAHGEEFSPAQQIVDFPTSPRRAGDGWLHGLSHAHARSQQRHDREPAAPYLAGRRRRPRRGGEGRERGEHEGRGRKGRSLAGCDWRCSNSRRRSLTRRRPKGRALTGCGSAGRRKRWPDPGRCNRSYP